MPPLDASDQRNEAAQLRMTAQPGATDLEILLGVLDLEAIGEGEFRGGQTPQTAGRTFGGLILAQAVIAGGRTVDAVAAVKSAERGRPVVPPRLHAVSGHFIRGGDIDAPIDYRVTTLRDGAAISNRLVEASQGGEVLCSLLLSYTNDKPGLEHEPDLAEVAAMAAPETLPGLDDMLAGYEERLTWFVEALRPIEFRYANDPAWRQKDSGQWLTHNQVWMRPDGVVPADPTIHAALLAYTSDTTLLDSILTTHGLSWGVDRVVVATINHSIWLHQPLDFTDWLLYSTQTPVAGGTRGLATGRFVRGDGRLVASVTQECVVRHFPHHGA